MNNIVYIGKYSLKSGYQPAEAKRVLGQIKYLENYHSILVITFSPFKSHFKFNLNFKTKLNKDLIDFLKFPFYWIYIIILLLFRKKNKNFLFLESIVESYSFVPIIFAKLFGYKIIHDIVEDFSLSNDISQNQKTTLLLSAWFEKRLNYYCSGLIVISEKLLDKYSNKQIPILKLYNSVEIQKCIDIKETFEDFTMFYSGSFGSKDGVLNLIEAFQKVSQKRNNISLTLVGKGYGEYFDKCLSKIQTTKKIQYLGYLHETKMIENIKKSHLLCITRTNNNFANFGFPYKIAEYMSFGIPVLTTTVSDIPIIFKDNDTVFFAKPEDINSITETIEKIITNYQLAIQVGKNGRKYAQEYFSIDYIGKKLNKFIDSL